MAAQKRGHIQRGLPRLHFLRELLEVATGPLIQIYIKGAIKIKPGCVTTSRNSSIWGSSSLVRPNKDGVFRLNSTNDIPRRICPWLF